MAKQSTIAKYKYFFNTCATELGKKGFSVNKLIDQIKGSKGIFYYAVELGFFTRTKAKHKGYDYKPTIDSFSDEQVESILELHSRKTYEARMLKELNENKGIVTLTTKKNTVYLCNASDDQIFSELKQRGYEGSITMKRTVNI